MSDSDSDETSQSPQSARDYCYGTRSPTAPALCAGAGKTTLLSILTADQNATSGDALICGASCVRDRAVVQRLIGYCPQFDPLLDLLTGREQLQMYARLKGLPEAEVVRVADSTLRRVGLGPFADRLSGQYSGGNKRKLSLAIALVGNPRVVYLDEPSSGLDAQARRNLWDTIARTTAGMAVILTTHSMEESEALCGRIGIMAHGQLRCLGSPQELKSRYGDGHFLDLKASAGRTVADAQRAVEAAAPGAVLLEQAAARLRFRFPYGELPLSVRSRPFIPQAARPPLNRLALNLLVLEPTSHRLLFCRSCLVRWSGRATMA